MTLEDIKREAEKDEFIRKVKKYVWLNERYKKGSKISLFSIYNQVLLYVNRVVISSLLQKKILTEFPISHLAISRMKSLMHSYTYWPWMNQDIEEIMKAFRGCQIAAKAPPV